MIYNRAVSAAGFDQLKQRWRARAEHHAIMHQARKALVCSRAPAVFQRFGIRQAILFGSLQDGRSTAHSDVDLLVMPLPPELYWPFRHALEQALERPVDVYTPDDDVRLVEKVLKRGELIYEA
jgi:predicted nucleotidyltransferase